MTVIRFFNPFTLGVHEKAIHILKNLQLKAAGFFLSMYDLSVETRC